MLTGSQNEAIRSRLTFNVGEAASLTWAVFIDRPRKRSKASACAGEAAGITEGIVGSGSADGGQCCACCVGTQACTGSCPRCGAGDCVLQFCTLAVKEGCPAGDGGWGGCGGGACRGCSVVSLIASAPQEQVRLSKKGLRPSQMGNRKAVGGLCDPYDA
eukprot:4848875-Pleurochrysis_carterae.AAC.4